jgi:Holliday junction DNA helicase RuvA
MSGKLGPKFALQLKAHSSWTHTLSHQDMSLVLISPNEEAFVIDIPSEIFRQQLLNSSEYVWVFLAQIIREDEEIWYGFSSPQERQIFDSLKELPGIGPKTTALLIGNLGVASLQRLLLGENPSLFKIPGVGPKTLARVAQGLQNDKERFLKLLTQPVNQNEILKVDSEKLSSSDDKQEGARAKSTPSAFNQTINKNNVALLSPAVLKGLERLGLKLDESLELYKEILQEKKLDNIDEKELLKLLIQQWGLWRARSKPAREITS